MLGLSSELILTSMAILLCVLVTLISWTDFREMRIPDYLTVMLGAAGVLSHLFLNNEFALWNIFFGMATALVFWLMRFGFFKLYGRPGLGLGDVKMAGVSAVWISPWLLSMFLLIASLTCIVYAALRALFLGRNTLNERIPFGPFLGFGLIVIWFSENIF